MFLLFSSIHKEVTHNTKFWLFIINQTILGVIHMLGWFNCIVAGIIDITTLLSVTFNYASQWFRPLDLLRLVFVCLIFVFVAFHKTFDKASTSKTVNLPLVNHIWQASCGHAELIVGFLLPD